VDHRVAMDVKPFTHIVAMVVATMWVNLTFFGS
jgi:hypothetical protein